MYLSRISRLAPLALAAALCANAAVVFAPLQSASDVCYGGGFVCLSGATLTPGPPTVIQVGADQTSTAPIDISGFFSIGGSPPSPLPPTTGGHGVTIYNRPSLGSTGTFEIEITALDLVGPAVRIRESPTRQSFGQTQVTDLGAGDFRIDSFFDIFTELSLDNGQNWLPSDNQSTGDHFQSSTFIPEVPEPSSLLLLSGAGLALLARRRRR